MNNYEKQKEQHAEVKNTSKEEVSSNRLRNKMQVKSSFKEVQNV